MSEHQIPHNVMQQFAKLCSCCVACAGRPCDGVMAGGICDDLCTCDRDEPFDDGQFVDDEPQV